MKIFSILTVWLAMNCPAFAQVVYTRQDVSRWQKTYQALQESASLPLPELIVKTGKTWIGTPYVAHTLDKEKTECLVVNLQEMDCTTYLESMLAMAKALQKRDTSFQTYTDFLQQVRYRNGQVNGYSSRLHYFSDWLYENEKQGNIQVITQALKGKALAKPINFMTTHREAYPALQNEAEFSKVAAFEQILNQRPIYYIPKAEVSRVESDLKEGDIIAITTHIKGLDVVHVGFAVLQNKRIHLLHASLDEKKVVISKKPLADYLMGNKNQAGIMVARVQQQ